MEILKPFCIHCQDPIYGCYVQLQETDNIGSRDSECSCCHEVLHEFEDLVMHKGCQHVFHGSCINLWIFSKGEDDPRASISCPMCRGTIYEPNLCKSRSFFSTPTETTPRRLMALMHTGANVKYVSALVATCEAQNCEGSTHAMTLVQNVLGLETQEVPSPRMNNVFKFRDDSRPASAIWQKRTEIYGGAFLVKHCNHNSEFILMTAEQMHTALPYLWLRGWDPVSGTIIPGVNAERGITLNQLVEQAKQLNVDEVTISYPQIEYLFPCFSAFDGGVSMTITLKRRIVDDGIYHFWIEPAAVVSVLGDTPFGSDDYIQLSLMEISEVISRLDPNFNTAVECSDPVESWLRVMVQIMTYRQFVLNPNLDNVQRSEFNTG